MKRKFLAKAITLGLMLAVPLGVEATNVTTEVNNQTITKWGEQTVINGGITNGTIVDNTLMELRAKLFKTVALLMILY